jgi:hypothetical protein
VPGRASNRPRRTAQRVTGSGQIRRADQGFWLLSLRWGGFACNAHAANKPNSGNSVNHYFDNSCEF